METGTEENRKNAGLADTSLQVDLMTDLISLDSSGDAVHAVGDPNTDGTIRFLISTKVLSLASLVFAKMFGPDFQE
ncbi:hypothetical protein BKA65DRAFT_45275 [Rhexocercosporidium sp. MPI-PUGE-AT-0058]|nr:hypothetical protein BKA65DRAFT_45275 [Rhexocercosporidium sp. MPI-PUGE-AT-0058]